MTLLDKNPEKEPKVPLPCRVKPAVFSQIQAKAQAKGHTTSSAAANLLEAVLELEARLIPVEATIEHLKKTERLTWAEAVARLVGVPDATNDVEDL